MKRIFIATLFAVLLLTCWLAIRSRRTDTENSASVSLDRSKAVSSGNNRETITKENLFPYMRRNARAKTGESMNSDHSNALDTVSVPSESGHLKTVSKSKYEAKQLQSEGIWESTRRLDQELGRNQVMREKENFLLQKSSHLQTGMTISQVIELLGEPNKLYAPYIKTNAESGITLAGSTHLTLQQQEKATTDTFFKYTPDLNGRTFNKPDEYFKVLTLGFDTNHTLFYILLEIPHPTVWVEYSTASL